MATLQRNNDPKDYSYSETKRHKPCLIYRGHRYVQDKIQNQTIYWRCVDRSHCNGRAHQSLVNDSPPIVTIDHNHPKTVDGHFLRRGISPDSCRTLDKLIQQEKQNLTTSKETDDYLISPPTQFSHYSNQSHNMHGRYPISTMLPLPSDVRVQPPPEIKSSTKTMNKRTIQSFSDQPSRLNQFSWEEIEGRFVPVIFRQDANGFHRYTSKTYVENILFKNPSWQRCIVFARTLRPLLSLPYTEHELKLFRSIVEWHAAGRQLKTISTADCLISFDELLNFYRSLCQIRDTLPNGRIESAPIKPIPQRPSPIYEPSPRFNQNDYLLPKTIPHVQPTISMNNTKQSGWVQVNQVFLPYIVKQNPSQAHSNLKDREVLIPYEILLKCRILSDEDFPFKNYLIKASREDFEHLNRLITDIHIFDEKVPDKTYLVNLYHLMMGIDPALYVKFLPTIQPRSEVNRFHSEVMKMCGGAIMIFDQQNLIPYLLQNNHFYVPFYYTCQFIPMLRVQAHRFARAPRLYEIDFLNLLCLYFCIQTPAFTSDTLLIDTNTLTDVLMTAPIFYRKLQEQQQLERKRLSLGCFSAPKNSKSTSDIIPGYFTSPKHEIHSRNMNTTSNQKPNKYQSGQVVINPLIHHPSFYGLTAPVPSLPMPSIPKIGSVPSSNSTDPDFYYSPPINKKPAAELKTITVNQIDLSAIVNSSDSSKDQWKISLKHIFERFKYTIDYHQFIQWSQANVLLPLVQLNQDEKKLIQSYDCDDFYIHQAHLERCVDLLNNLQCGSISMTLLPNPPASISEETIPISGSKKRKLTLASPQRRASTPVIEHVESVSKPNSPAFIETVSMKNDVDIDEENEKMPVVASVEEEQPLDIPNETDLSDTETLSIYVASTDGSDEKILFDDVIPSCSSGYESLPALISSTAESDENESTVNRIDQQSSRGHDDSCRSNKRTNKKMKVEDDQSISLKIIKQENINQVLRTLFMMPNEKYRTRTRSVKTPTRLLEELSAVECRNQSGVSNEPNVFEIFSSFNPSDRTSQRFNSNDDHR